MPNHHFFWGETVGHGTQYLAHTKHMLNHWATPQAPTQLLCRWIVFHYRNVFFIHSLANGYLIASFDCCNTTMSTEDTFFVWTTKIVLFSWVHPALELQCYLEFWRAFYSGTPAWQCPLLHPWRQRKNPLILFLGIHVSSLANLAFDSMGSGSVDCRWPHFVKM